MRAQHQKRDHHRLRALQEAHVLLSGQVPAEHQQRAQRAHGQPHLQHLGGGKLGRPPQQQRAGRGQQHHGPVVLHRRGALPPQRALRTQRRQVQPQVHVAQAAHRQRSVHAALQKVHVLGGLTQRQHRQHTQERQRHIEVPQAQRGQRQVRASAPKVQAAHDHASVGGARGRGRHQCGGLLDVLHHKHDEVVHARHRQVGRLHQQAADGGQHRALRRGGGHRRAQPDRQPQSHSKAGKQHVAHCLSISPVSAV